MYDMYVRNIRIRRTGIHVIQVHVHVRRTVLYNLQRTKRTNTIQNV